MRGALEINLRSSRDLSHADGGDQRRQKCVKVHSVGLISVAVEEEEQEEAGPMAFVCRVWPAGGREQVAVVVRLSVRCW